MGKPFSLATLAAQSKKSVDIAAAHFRVSSTTKLLVLVFAMGVVLLTLASVLDAKGVYMPGNGLRWLYLVGVVSTCMIIWNGLVELVYTWLELRFFLRLVMLPSAQLLFKVWLNAFAAFVSFQQLFGEFTVGGLPPAHPLSTAENWVKRLLLCLLLFCFVSVAVTAASHVTVALLYSEGSRQKIVAAMQHAYVMYRLVRDKLYDEDERVADGVGGGSGEKTAAAAPPPPMPPPPHADGDGTSGRRHGEPIGGLSAFARRQRTRRRSTLRATQIPSFKEAQQQGQQLQQEQQQQQQHLQQVGGDAAGSRVRQLSCRRADTALVSAPPPPSPMAVVQADGAAGRPAVSIATPIDTTLLPPPPVAMAGSQLAQPATPRGPAAVAEPTPPLPPPLPNCDGTQVVVHLRPASTAAAASCDDGAAVSAANPADAPSRRNYANGAGSSGGCGSEAGGNKALDFDLDLPLELSLDPGPADLDPKADSESDLGENSDFDGRGGLRRSGGGGESSDRMTGSGGGGAASRAAAWHGGSCSWCSCGLRLRRRGDAADADGGAAGASYSAPSSMSSIADGGPSAQQRSYASLNQAMRCIQDTEMVHVRRTLLASLEIYDWLRERSQLPLGALSRGGAAAAVANAHGVARRELHAMRLSGVRQIISPRALLDEMLLVYGSLSDSDIPMLARHFADAVWECAAPDGDNIVPEDFVHIFPREQDRQIAWDALDGDKDGLLTRSDVVAAVTTFLQQERSMALNVRAVRRLTMSLQTSLIAIINGIFLMAVYLSILDLARFFSGGSTSKTSLDIFSAYVLVVSLIFSEQIRHVLLGCVLILSQQPFDVGEELVIEESPGWRVMGIVQDFNLFYLRVKKSTDGELVTLPLNRLVSGRFTNLSRSDWKIEQNYFAVDASTPPSVLAAITDAALAVIRATPGEYDVSYGFLAVYHGFERPNKVVIRTFHRYKFNLSAAHKRIALARHGVMSAIRQTLDKLGVEFTELRLHGALTAGGLPYPPGATAAADAAAAAAAVAAAAAAGFGDPGIGAPPGAAMPAALDYAAGASPVAGPAGGWLGGGFGGGFGAAAPGGGWGGRAA